MYPCISLYILRYPTHTVRSIRENREVVSEANTMLMRHDEKIRRNGDDTQVIQAHSHMILPNSVYMHSKKRRTGLHQQQQ